MRKIVILLLMCCVVLGGCGNSGVSKEEFDNMSKENENLKDDNSKLSKEKQALQQEYDNYRESMKEYEGLSSAEAKAREIEAKKIAEEQKAEEESKKKEEQEKAEQEEKIGYETGITFEQLARTPDDYVDKKVKFKGEVVQIVESEDEDYISMRLAVDSDYDKIIFCQYDKKIVSYRILEEDIVTVYGISCGLYTYESTLGGYITVPCVAIDKIEQ